MMIEKHWLT